MDMTLMKLAAALMNIILPLKRQSYRHINPVAVVAVGALAAPGTASPEVAERDGAARERAALEEIAFAGTWGRPWSADD